MVVGGDWNVANTNRKCKIRRIIGELTCMPGQLTPNGNFFGSAYGVCIWLVGREETAIGGTNLDPTDAGELTDEVVLWRSSGAFYYELVGDAGVLQSSPGHHPIDIHPNRWMNNDQAIVFTARGEALFEANQPHRMYLHMRTLLELS